ncbi:MAG: PEP-CTERM sorting domain-containing protein [Cyanobacteria bacterium P01_H01_bin.35]
MNILNSKFLAGLTAAIAFTGVTANAGIANAAALIGEFQFVGLGAASLTQEELNFEFNPTNLFISSTTAIGSFNQFAGMETTITSPVVFNPFSAPIPFIDFGDNNVFNLQEASIGEFIQSGDNTSVDIILKGTFFSADGDQSDGSGNITIQFNDALASDIEQQVEDGETLTAQFSGALFSEETRRVPEPSAILGLGLFAGAGILSKKKLANKA